MTQDIDAAIEAGIHTQMFSDPSGNVRGVSSITIDLRRTGTKTAKAVTLAKATFFTDKSSDIETKLPTSLDADALAVAARALSRFAAHVAGKDSARVDAARNPDPR